MVDIYYEYQKKEKLLKLQHPNRNEFIDKEIEKFEKTAKNLDNAENERSAVIKTADIEWHKNCDTYIIELSKLKREKRQKLFSVSKIAGFHNGQKIFDKLWETAKSQTDFTYQDAWTLIENYENAERDFLECINLLNRED